MKLYQILFIALGLGLVSCSPKVRSNISNTSYSQLESIDEVIVLDKGEEVPEQSIFIGDLKIGDSGFSTNCGYNIVMLNARQTAQKSGANIIEITDIKKPNLLSSCYRIKGKLYRNMDDEKLSDLVETRTRRNKSRLPENADYAMVYFYRPSNFQSSMIGFKIRKEDGTIIGRVRNGEKFSYKVTSFGPQEFKARTESETAVMLDIQPGEEYFVRCSLKYGVAVGRPQLDIIENYIGIQEYDEMK